MNYIFDLDGTLVDSLPGIAFSVNAALAACGLPPADGDLGTLLGPPIRDILTQVSGTPDVRVLDRLEANFRASYDVEGWQLTACLPGVADLLWRLVTGGNDLWMVTNKPPLPTARILGQLNLAGFFREVACRTSASASKAEVLIDLIERNGLPRDTCLMVGDTAEDARAAEAAGIACAIVGPGANLLESVTV